MILLLRNTSQKPLTAHTIRARPAAAAHLVGNDNHAWLSVRHTHYWPSPHFSVCRACPAALLVALAQVHHAGLLVLLDMSRQEKNEKKPTPIQFDSIQKQARGRAATIAATITAAGTRVY